MHVTNFNEPTERDPQNVANKTCQQNVINENYENQPLLQRPCVPY